MHAFILQNNCVYFLDQYEIASAGLRDEISCLRNASDAYDDDVYDVWAADMEECEMNVRSKSAYKQKGFKLQKNM